MKKNVASQKVTLLAVDTVNNVPKTGDAGNITAYASLNDGAVTILTDTSATELDATNAPGLYAFDLTQAETNADKIVFSGKSSTTGIRIVPRTEYPVAQYFSVMSIDSSGRVDASVSVWEAVQASHTNAGTFGRYLDAQVSGVATQASLNAVSNTVNTVNTAIALTPGLVWEEATASHANTGTFGEKVGSFTGSAPTANDVANAVWTAVVAEVSNDADLRANIGKMVRGLFERFFNKVTQTGAGASGVRTHYKDDGTNTFATMPVADDGTTQTQGPSS